MSKEIFYPNRELFKDPAIKSMEQYRDIMKRAENDYEGFWGDLAREKIDWAKPFDRVLNEDDAPFYKWFEGGELNVAYINV